MSAQSDREPEVSIDLVDWDDPDATRLRVAQQAELRELYGDDDIGHTMTGESIVAMVLVRGDGVPAACGALRDVSDTMGAGVGELKRMYVVPGYRGRGLSRVVLTDLEERARALGFGRLILETGVLQSGAIGLYLTSGYHSIENFGEYEDAAESRCFAKDLHAAPRRSSRGAAAPGSARSDKDDDVPDDDAAHVRHAVTLRAVGWDDPDAVRLRRAMFDEENLPRYPELGRAIERMGGYEVNDAAEGAGGLTTLIADVDGEPVACVALRTAGPGVGDHAGELKKVFVRGAARGLGLARTLLAEIEVEARARGLNRLVLHTGRRQPEAMTLYLSVGYRPIPPFAPYVGDPIAMCFAKDL
ncbi:MAG TPA: GNAT family N-acetyltransferase [Cellulomonas sp.]|uniref:GNAT family N-acetyltransferase n=1 Tax=Cellulomonas sp. TaxID=40001 RepID=UPI002E330609|nr:GNAT family N-acetyltransferase [Cellulomonas sp.]HEX5333908.1 GNAT family N-acetyltransferase [Cellulomonas sp.]